MKQQLITGAILMGYGALWRWYSNRRGPLTPQEIEGYLAKMAVRNPDPAALQRIRAFLESDTGRGFVMVNLIKLREKPLPIPNMPQTDEPSAKVLRRYTSQFLPAILRRAGHPILVGQAAAEALELWGTTDSESWTNVGLVRYRSRRDMIEAATHPDFFESHPFKHAAMEKTIAVPIDPWRYAGDPRLLAGLLALIALLGMALVTRRRGLP